MMSWYTSVVWMFRFPDMMACSVGYLIPSSQGISSCPALLIQSRCDIPAILGPTSPSSMCWPSASASAASTSKERRYCKCPARTCQRMIQRKTSLLLVHCASLLQKSM